MTYIEETLSTDEEIQAIFGLSFINYIGLYFYASIILSASFLVFHYFRWELLSLNFILTVVPLLVIASPKFIFLNSIENGVTNRRFSHKIGVFSRETKEIRLEAIETIEIEQNFFGRLFNYGNVHISGRGKQNIILENIDEPIQVKKCIEIAAEARENKFEKEV